MKRFLTSMRAFTLVELIVVITVLAILSTLAFVSFTRYSSQARDVVRLSDIENIDTGLSVFHAYKSMYPDPTQGVDITLEGATIWNQGVFGVETAREMGKIFGELRDPLYGNNYSYSTTASKTEYQLSYILEKSNGFWQSIRGISYNPSFDVPQAYASSVYDVGNLNPVIWLDGRDMDGDGDETDNPADGAVVSSWVNKGTRGSSGNPTITHGTITYESNAVNNYSAPIIGKKDGMRFENSSISQGEIYYVLHDSGGKASGYALQGTQKNYIIGSFKNYRNSLRIGNAPSHINTSPSLKNTMKRKAFLYSFLTDGENYEFRNVGNLVSQGATNPISGVTWAINKAGGYNRNNELADWAIGELIIFDTSLSDDERFEIEGYLAHKWLLDGYLSGNHPYKNTPPVTTVDEPEEVPEVVVEVQEFPNAPVFVKGNYNKLFTHGINSLGSHIIATTPSIIASDLSSVDFLDIVQDQKLVYTGYENIPAAYEGDNFTSTGGLDFSIESPLAFSGSRFDLASYDGVKQIDAVMRTSYQYAPFYKDISDNFSHYQTSYVENILGDVVGINPIKPYFCSEILDRKFIHNIAGTATIDASPTGIHSGVSGVGGLNNKIISVEGKNNFEFQTDVSGGYIELRWNEDVPIGFLRIYNTIGTESSYLSGATVSLFKSGEVEPRYSHILWDTSADYIVDLDFEGIGEVHEVDILRIEAAHNQKFSLRELEVYIGGDVKSGYYTVDSDGIGGKAPYQVYCDMETDGGGWTRVGDNFINRSNFDHGLHSDFFNGYNSSGNKNELGKNTIRSDITPPSEIPNVYVLRHSDDANGYYELFFDDIPNIEFTTEIRLGAWVKGTQKTPFHSIIDYEGMPPQEFPVETDESVNPNIWRYETIRFPITDVLEDFTWQIGKGVSAGGTPMYVTGLSLELFYK